MDTLTTVYGKSLDGSYDINFVKVEDQHGGTVFVRRSGDVFQIQVPNVTCFDVPASAFTLAETI